MTDFRMLRGFWGEDKSSCRCSTCVEAEMAFLLLSQRTRIHHTYKKPEFGSLTWPEIVATYLLKHASPWFVKENHD